MGRKTSGSWKWRVAGGLLMLAVIAAAWGWWHLQGWRPDRAQYPVQGVLLGEVDGPITAAMLQGAGAGFAYLEASEGADGRDAQFADTLEALAGSGLPVGAVHAYDPCVPADRQAANFVTIVPRDPAQLPPAIALDTLASACNDPVIEAGVESELMTFINQVENHTGQPVVLLISPEFEARYGIAARIERNLWLSRDFLEPEYAGRPWTLWTANTHLDADMAERPLRWVVVRP
jgi:lysozyme